MRRWGGWGRLVWRRGLDGHGQANGGPGAYQADRGRPGANERDNSIDRTHADTHTRGLNYDTHKDGDRAGKQEAVLTNQPKDQ